MLLKSTPGTAYVSVTHFIIPIYDMLVYPEAHFSTSLSCARILVSTSFLTPNSQSYKEASTKTTTLSIPRVQKATIVRITSNVREVRHSQIWSLQSNQDNH